MTHRPRRIALGRNDLILLEIAVCRAPDLRGEPNPPPSNVLWLSFGVEHPTGGGKAGGRWSTGDGSRR